MLKEIEENDSKNSEAFNVLFNNFNEFRDNSGFIEKNDKLKHTLEI